MPGKLFYLNSEKCWAFLDLVLWSPSSQLWGFTALFWFFFLQNFRSTAYASHAHTHGYRQLLPVSLSSEGYGQLALCGLKKKSTIQIIFCITENKSSLVSRGDIKRNSKIIRHIPEVRLLLNHWAQGYFGQLCNMAGNGLFGLPSEFTPAMQKTYA